MSPTRKQSQPATFEAAFLELQQVVEQLEDGSIDLERALALFDRGSELADACTGLIEAAELRVTRLDPEPASPLSDASADPLT